MTITASFSQFRQHMAEYMTHTRKGHIIALKDEKRGEIVADVVPRKTFDPVAYRAMLKRVAGTFTAEHHPEWATKKDVEQWVRQSRIADERHF